MATAIFDAAHPRIGFLFPLFCSAELAATLFQQGFFEPSFSG
jgi:hypothetical protein